MTVVDGPPGALPARVPAGRIAREGRYAHLFATRKATRMSFKTFDELRRPDDRSLAFTPIGLGVGVQMRPEAAAEYQQHVMAQLDLDPRVADGTRRRFEDLRTASVDRKSVV